MKTSKKAAERRKNVAGYVEKNRKKGAFERVREAFFGERQMGIVAPLGATTGFGKAPDVKFETMIDYYKSEPEVKDAIDEYADSLVGAGLYLTGDNANALKFGEDYVHDINLDGILQTATRELLCTGNWIAEKEPIETMERIIPLPISSIKRFKTDTIYSPPVKIHQVRAGKMQFIPYSKVIHWALNRIDASLWGCGLLEALLRSGIGYRWKDQAGTPHTDYRPSTQSIMEEVEDSMRKAVRRYTPRTVYALLGFQDPAVTRHANTIAGIRPEDDLVIGHPKAAQARVEVSRVGTDPRSRLHPFIEHFHNKQVTGTQSASQKIARGQVTEASATQLINVHKWKISAVRRFIKREIEKTILKPRITYLMKWEAYSEALWKKANIRVRWGIIEEPEIEPESIIRLCAISAKYGINFITPPEVRKYLEKRGIELDASVKVPKLIPAPKPSKPFEKPPEPSNGSEKEREEEEEEEEEES